MVIDYNRFKESETYQYAVDVLDSKFPKLAIGAVVGKSLYEACIDEAGAAKDGGLIESMTSGMLSVQNRLLI